MRTRNTQFKFKIPDVNNVISHEVVKLDVNTDDNICNFGVQVVTFDVNSRVNVWNLGTMSLNLTSNVKSVFFLSF